MAKSLRVAKLWLSELAKLWLSAQTINCLLLAATRFQHRFPRQPNAASLVTTVLTRGELCLDATRSTTGIYDPKRTLAGIATHQASIRSAVRQR